MGVRDTYFRVVCVLPGAPLPQVYPEELIGQWGWSERHCSQRGTLRTTPASFGGEQEVPLSSASWAAGEEGIGTQWPVTCGCSVVRAYLREAGGKVPDPIFMKKRKVHIAI